MGYSKSSRAAQRVANYIAEMKAGDGRKTIVWEEKEDITKRAYQIREALQQPELSFLKAKYILRTKGNNIIAEPRAITPLEVSLGTVTLYKLNDVLSLIGAALQHKANTFYFPDAVDVDLNKLYNWTSKNGYYIVPSDDGITLTKDNPGVAAWEPES